MSPYESYDAGFNDGREDAEFDQFLKEDAERSRREDSRRQAAEGRTRPPPQPGLVSRNSVLPEPTVSQNLGRNYR